MRSGNTNFLFADVLDVGVSGAGSRRKEFVDEGSDLRCCCGVFGVDAHARRCARIVESRCLVGGIHVRADCDLLSATLQMWSISSGHDQRREPPGSHATSYGSWRVFGGRGGCGFLQRLPDNPAK